MSWQGSGRGDIVCLWLSIDEYKSQFLMSFFLISSFRLQNRTSWREGKWFDLLEATVTQVALPTLTHTQTHTHPAAHTLPPSLFFVYYVRLASPQIHWINCLHPHQASTPKLICERQWNECLWDICELWLLKAGSLIGDHCKRNGNIFR